MGSSPGHSLLVTVPSASQSQFRHACGHGPASWQPLLAYKPPAKKLPGCQHTIGPNAARSRERLFGVMVAMIVRGT